MGLSSHKSPLATHTPLWQAPQRIRTQSPAIQMTAMLEVFTRLRIPQIWCLLMKTSLARTWHRRLAIVIQRMGAATEGASSHGGGDTSDETGLTVLPRCSPLPPVVETHICVAPKAATCGGVRRRCACKLAEAQAAERKARTASGLRFARQERERYGGGRE